MFLKLFSQKRKMFGYTSDFQSGIGNVEYKVRWWFEKRDNSFKIIANFSRLLFAITNMLIPYISLCWNYLHLYTCMPLFIIFQPTFFLNGQIFNLPPSSLSLHSCSYTTPSARYLLIVYPPSPPCLSVTPLVCRLFCAVLAHTHRPLGSCLSVCPIRPPLPLARASCIAPLVYHPHSSSTHCLPVHRPLPTHCHVAWSAMSSTTWQGERGDRGSFIFFTTIFEVGVFSSFSQYYKIEKWCGWCKWMTFKGK
jgi:hypothetical protein